MFNLLQQINAHAMSQALSPDTKPLVALGTALGKVAVALLGGVDAQTEISVSTQGELLVFGDRFCLDSNNNDYLI